MNTQPKTAKNKLSNAQFLATVDHIRAEHSTFGAKTPATLANGVTKSLGFVVTESNLRSVAATAGIKLAEPKSSRRKTNGHSKDLRLVARTLIDVIEGKEIGTKRFNCLHRIAETDLLLTEEKEQNA